MIIHAVFLLPKPEATREELQAAMQKAKALKEKIPVGGEGSWNRRKNGYANVRRAKNFTMN